MAKKAVTGIPVKSWEEVEKLLLEYAKLESFLTETEADMNRELQNIRDKFAKVTANQTARYNQIKTDIQQYALTQKSEFDKTRSREFPFAKVGFRYGKPKVALLNRKYNWEIVIELIKKLFGGEYIRQKEELNKEVILSNYAEGKITDQQIAGCGVKIEQDESFFIDLKWDNFPKE
jgi:phage host-nuclease inhibitor protein Gam